MTDQQVSRYLELVSRLAYIHAHSGVEWRPEYGPELEAVRTELAALRPLVEMERRKRYAKKDCGIWPVSPWPPCTSWWC